MRQALTFQPVMAPWAVLLLAVALGAGVYLYYRREEELPARRRAVLAALRAVGLAVLVFVLAGPTLSRDETVRRSRPLTILVDTSKSMSVEDSGPDANRARIDAARDALERVGPDLAAKYDVRLYRFAAAADFLSSSPSDVARDDVGRDARALAADGTATALGDALLQAAPRAAPGAILVLSDGASNAGQTERRAADALAKRGVSIFSVPFGRAGRPNVAVKRVLGPRLLLCDEPSAFFAEVASTGASSPVPVALKENGRTVATADAAPAATSLVRLNFKPASEGDITYTIEAAALPAEENLADNAVTRTVRVAREKLKVLYVESEPRWEYRFIKNAVLRDERIDPKLLLLSGDKELAAAPYAITAFPHARADLFKFDCIVIGDVSDQIFLPGDLDNMRAFVSEGGGGVLFISGANYDPARYSTGPLADLCPADSIGAAAVSADGYAISLTDAGATSPPLALSAGDQKAFWKTLPKILWLARVRPRPGAAVLAESLPDKLPVIIEQPFGRGRTMLIATDELWRWRSLGGDKYLYRLWAQLVRYIGARRLSAGSSAGELVLSADEYPLGGTVSGTAYLENGFGMPFDDASAEGFVEDSSGRRVNVTFSRQADAPGLYRTEFPCGAPGKYALNVRGLAGFASAPFVVAGRTVEDLSTEANPAALEGIAAATGGRVLAPGRILDILTLFPPEMPPETRTRVTPLWASYWILVPLAVLLSAEWYLRKRWGLM